jgi:hypothetical protein
VLVDGPREVTGVHRQVLTCKRLSLTDIVVKIPRNAKEKKILAAWEVNVIINLFIAFVDVYCSLSLLWIHGMLLLGPRSWQSRPSALLFPTSTASRSWLPRNRDLRLLATSSAPYLPNCIYNKRTSFNIYDQH